MDSYERKVGLYFFTLYSAVNSYIYLEVSLDNLLIGVGGGIFVSGVWWAIGEEGQVLVIELYCWRNEL